MTTAATARAVQISGLEDARKKNTARFFHRYSEAYNP